VAKGVEQKKNNKSARPFSPDKKETSAIRNWPAAACSPRKVDGKSSFM
jgi:hypothetical protein